MLAGVGDLDATDDDIAAIQGALRDSGALAAVEAEIAELAGLAREAVARADIPPEATAALTDLVGLVAFRAT